EPAPVQHLHIEQSASYLGGNISGGKLKIPPASMLESLLDLRLIHVSRCCFDTILLKCDWPAGVPEKQSPLSSHCIRPLYRSNHPISFQDDSASLLVPKSGCLRIF